MGRNGVRWQGQAQACPALRLDWMLWAQAHEEKQRGQRAPGRLNRVCSAVTRVVNLLVGKILNGHSAMQAVDSGQLRFLGSSCLGRRVHQHLGLGLLAAHGAVGQA